MVFELGSSHVLSVNSVDLHSVQVTNDEVET